MTVKLTLNPELQASFQKQAQANGLSLEAYLEHGLTLVTRNDRDFNGMGVPIFNPWL